MSTATAWLHDLLDALGSGRAYPTSPMRQCPAHNDGRPSLAVEEGRDGRAVLHCFGGCHWTAVLAALTLPARYLFTPPPVNPAAYADAFISGVTFPPMSTYPRSAGRSGPPARGYRLVAVHDYGPNHRVLRYRRGKDKTLCWESLRGSVWELGLYGTPLAALPIYEQRQVEMGVAAGEPVLLVESESSVDRLVHSGWYSTTWAGGAAAVQVSALRAVLADYPRLVVIPDHDPAGHAALDRLAAAGLAPHVLLPDEGDDARDLIKKVGDDQFRILVTTALAESRDSRKPDDTAA